MAIIDSFSSTNKDYDTSEMTAGYRGQSFTVPAGAGYTVTGIQFFIKKGTSGAGTLKAGITGHTGTYGTGSLSDSTTMLVESTAINLSGLSTNQTLVNFPISSTVGLSASTYYCAVLSFVGTGGGVIMGLKNSSAAPTHPGNYFSSTTPYNARDWCFEVDGTAISTSTTISVPAPDTINVASPTPTVTSGVNITVPAPDTINVVSPTPSVGWGVTVPAPDTINVASPTPIVTSGANITVPAPDTINVVSPSPKDFPTYIGVSSIPNITVTCPTPSFSMVGTVKHKNPKNVKKDRKTWPHTLRNEINLNYSRANYCPTCETTAITRILHSTSYDWQCINAHTWIDEGALKTKIQKIKW